MSAPAPLRRSAGDGRAAPPVRLVHLGLGSFFRAHQAWYTDRAPDAQEWGWAAFTGRSAGLAERLSAQDGLYTLVTRGGADDRFDVVGSLAEAHPGRDLAAWRRLLASPSVAVVSLTVTEAAYLRRPDGRPDLDHEGLRADLAALRAGGDADVSTVPGRLVAGLLARCRADAGPLALVPCDNLPGNGEVLGDVVRAAVAEVGGGLARWVDENVRVVTTMVDRITPRTTDDDVTTVRERTGRDDACPVVTEPFSEWVLSGEFPAGRPAWDAAGATVVEDPAPFEQRKLRLLNGAHSLLAYAGSVRGAQTVADAVEDPVCRAWLEAWWDEAGAGLALPADVLGDYREALLGRFANPRMRHALAQIAADGSQKMPVRVVPVLQDQRARGLVPTGAVHAVAGWLCHLRGAGAPVQDVRADEASAAASGPLDEAAGAVLGLLDPPLRDDRSLVEAVATAAADLEGRSG